MLKFIIFSKEQNYIAKIPKKIKYSILLHENPSPSKIFCLKTFKSELKTWGDLQYIINLIFIIKLLIDLVK